MRYPLAMPKLSKDEVRHIAKLARLSLSEADVEKFTTELTSILEYVGKLQEVDTKGVEATAQMTGLSNVFRDDAVCPSEVNADALLATSPLPLRDHQIETPSAHG